MDPPALTKVKSESQDVKMTTRNLENSTNPERNSKLDKEIKEFRQNIYDLDIHKFNLHNQMKELRAKIAPLNNGLNNIPDVLAINNSVGELVEDCKYYDKDLAMAKINILSAENMRLKSSIEAQEKKMKESDPKLEEGKIDATSAQQLKEELKRTNETLKTVVDSNQHLRQERDRLMRRVSQLSTIPNSLIPIKRRCIELTERAEFLFNDNVHLKGEASRWRERSNALIARRDKENLNDWHRLQTQRENLSKLLLTERDINVKCSEELNIIKMENSNLKEQLLVLQKQTTNSINTDECKISVKHLEELNEIKMEKAKLEEQLAQLRKQMQIQGEQVINLSMEACKLGQDLNDSLAEEFSDNETVLNDIRVKVKQIWKITQMYRTHFDLTIKKEKTKDEEQMESAPENTAQLRDKGRKELRKINLQLTSQIDELTKQLKVVQAEADSLRKEIDAINATMLRKQEQANEVQKSARMEIEQLTESKKIHEQDLIELKAKIEFNTVESQNKIAALISEMEEKVSRFEREKIEMQAENKSLLEKVNHSNTSSGVSDSKAITESPKENIIRQLCAVQCRKSVGRSTTDSLTVTILSPQRKQQAIALVGQRVKREKRPRQTSVFNKTPEIYTRLRKRVRRQSKLSESVNSPKEKSEMVKSECE